MLTPTSHLKTISFTIEKFYGFLSHWKWKQFRKPTKPFQYNLVKNIYALRGTQGELLTKVSLIFLAIDKDSREVVVRFISDNFEYEYEAYKHEEAERVFQILERQAMNIVEGSNNDESFVRRYEVLLRLQDLGEGARTFI